MYIINRNDKEMTKNISLNVYGKIKSYVSNNDVILTMISIDQHILL